MKSPRDAAHTEQRDGSVPEVVVAAPATAIGAPLVRLLRPRQWIKNAFVLAPAVFAGVFLDVTALTNALLAVLLFSLASSAVYVLNDLHDLEKDRQHPVKRYSRPLAAGTVSVRTARILLLGLLGTLLAFAPFRFEVVGVIFLYIVLNALYSWRLKHVPVVDLFCVASGFVLRVFVGAVAVAVPLSSWMLITTLCLALYLAAIKRRQELGGSGIAGRSVLGSYSVALLDRYAEMAAVGAIVFYGLFVIEVRPELSITIPLVLFGIFRYWYVVESLGGGESPTDALYKDLVLALTVLTWGGLAMIITLIY